MERGKLVRSGLAVVLTAALAVTGAAFVGGDDERALHPQTLAAVPPAVAVAAEAISKQPARPAEEAPALELEELVSIDEEDRDRLASEMARWKTRHPRELVEVIANLAEQQPLSVSPAFLLSIAWSETRGKILAVSPAGAAGLAQATPAAYLSEGLDGKVFVTTDYLMGARAYIMKKPLGDALSISRSVMRTNTPAMRRRALDLVDRAIELRNEGIDELEALRPVANATFFRRIEEGEAHNLRTLSELKRLIERGAPRGAMKQFHARVQRDYTYLRNLQRTGWQQYANALTARRDTMLRNHYGLSPSNVIQTRPYEAGEYLGRTLDARFSPSQMAKFLAAHVETKQEQARELGIADEKLNAWTAALYNGGSVNVKRMLAGLIGSLAETQKYMKAVPARSAMLERTLG
jgi:hypothetical protein